MPSTPARSFRAEPRPDLGRLAVARRLAAGYAPAEAARAAGVAAPEVEALLAEEGFAELVGAYREVEGRPEDEQVARLVRVAKCVLEDALNRGDARAALFVIREGEERGRSPARLLAERAVRELRRRAEAAVAQPAAVAPEPLRPAPRCRPAVDPNDRVLWRVGARLRRALVAEHVAVSEEPSPPPSPPGEGEGARGQPLAPRVRPLSLPVEGEGRGGGSPLRPAEKVEGNSLAPDRHQRRRASALAHRRPFARSRGSP